MSIDEVWKKFKKTKDIDLKKIIIEEYIHLVRIVAGRMYNFYGGNVEYDDLISFGVFGLIDAIDKFDLDRNLKFETYAQIRIRGAMIDNLRKLDWVPRSLRKKAKELEKVVNKLENSLSRTITNDDIAMEMGITKEEVEDIFSEISTFNLVSFEEILDIKSGVNIRGNSRDNPEEIFDEKELKKIIKATIDKLPNKERMVISLYYYDELTYKEIGKVLDLSESRISQIHSKAILGIKNLLKKNGVLNMGGY
ncbi:FliA/WhiG family RNA polymerase sigma factor [Dethiothermospora halolimnae]|uniref:FliA/WhiG family RNA polymerase sigma factor n=1 Tax=Dethiothermospora halolimnae TaxID=3114390 RepID=UPI003CCC3061